VGKDKACAPYVVPNPRVALWLEGKEVRHKNAYGAHLDERIRPYRGTAHPKSCVQRHRIGVLRIFVNQ
jgi:hypothetical protein